MNAQHLYRFGLRLAHLIWVSVLFVSPVFAQPAPASSNVAAELSELQMRYGVIFAFDHSRLSRITVTKISNSTSLKEALTYLSDEGKIEFLEQQPGRYLVTELTVTSIQRTDTRRILSGVVLDEESGLAVPYASLRCFSQKTGVNCDKYGRFQLQLTGSDTATLLISSLGYQAVRVVLSASGSELLTIRLTPAPANLDEILIVEGNASVMHLADGGQTLTVSPRRLEMLSGTGEADVFRSLQWMPGISGGGKDGVALNVRGGGTDQNLLLWDGIPIFRPDHFFGQFSALNPAAIGDVAVYRSGFGARYGGRVSSVIDAEAKEPDTAKAHFSAGVNLLQANAALEAPMFNKKGTLLIAARRAYSDVYESPFFQGFFGSAIAGTTIGNEIESIVEDTLPFTTRPTFSFGDLNARLTYSPGKRTTLRASLFTGRDRLRYELNSIPGSGLGRTQINDKLQLGLFGSSLGWQFDVSHRLWIRAQAGYSQNTSQYRGSWNFTNSVGQYFFNTYQTAELKDASFALEAGGTAQNWNWATGVQANHQDVFRYAKSGPILMDQATEAGWTVAPYAEARWEKNKVSVTAGLRLPWYSPLEKIYAEPRFSASYQPIEPLRIRASAGRYHQFVNQKRVFNLLQLGEEFWALAQREEDVVASTHTSAGASFEKKNWLLDLEIYQKAFSGINTYLPSPVLESFPFPIIMEEYRSGSSRARGVDALLQRTEGNWTGWVSYSLAKVDLRFDSLLQGAAFPATHDLRHEVKVAQMLQFNRWDLSALWYLGSGVRYTAPDGLLSYRTPDSVTTYTLEYGAPNANRLPMRHRLDLTASFRLNAEQANWSGRVGLALYNVYNQANAQGIRFSVEEPTSKRDEAIIVSSKQFAPGFSPNLFFQFRF